MFQHLVDDGAYGAASGDAYFQALRPERLDLLRVGLLQVETIADRCERCHAAKDFERHLYDFLRLWHQDRLQDNFTWRLLGAGKGAPEHHGISPEQECLRDT